MTTYCLRIWAQIGGMCFQGWDNFFNFIQSINQVTIKYIKNKNLIIYRYFALIGVLAHDVCKVGLFNHGIKEGMCFCNGLRYTVWQFTNAPRIVSKYRIVVASCRCGFNGNVVSRTKFLKVISQCFDIFTPHYCIPDGRKFGSQSHGQTRLKAVSFSMPVVDLRRRLRLKCRNLTAGCLPGRNCLPFCPREGNQGRADSQQPGDQCLIILNKTPTSHINPHRDNHDCQSDTERSEKFDHNGDGEYKARFAQALRRAA